ncbi:hypothetical protein [Candidatus Nitrosotenuis aquarius]|uniref:hypothetical protein n=1 Tax=Candidatus Nitrosotenuis aquarius TaxID=1846278 RepID=UPI0013C2FA01|nr:hypothetical protein [Candidatus Nitrosotenuis aquarius]
MGLLSRKKLKFEKIKITSTKINSNEFCTITFNIRNFKDVFAKITAITKTDDVQNQYLRIDKPQIELPSLDFENRNTGDHSVLITPYNIPLNKMLFRITVEVFTDDNNKPQIKKEFRLTVNKKPST